MPENRHMRKLRMTEIIQALKVEFPNSKCSLNFKSPFQLLVATILSAQCTDERVNQVTKKLFSKYPNVGDYSSLTVDEIGKEIYSTGFFNNKARSIKNMTVIIMNKYDGEIPDTLEELVKLPGVGRKTANVVMGTAFNVPSIVVDTHVIRIMNLLNFVAIDNPVKIEMSLMKIVEKDVWTLFTHLFIDHGRKTCIARRPQCDRCVISHLCPSMKS